MSRAVHSELQHEQQQQQVEQHEQQQLSEQEQHLEQSESLELQEERARIHRLVESIHEQQHISSEQLVVYKSLIDLLNIGGEVSEFCERCSTKYNLFLP